MIVYLYIFFYFFFIFIFIDANKIDLVNSNWHYFVEFDEIINTGTTGKYMGKTQDVISYIYNNINEIPLDVINYKYNNDEDLLYILHGITFGITLQRIMELSSSSEISNKITYPDKINTNLAFSVIKTVTQELEFTSFYGEILFNSNGFNTAHKGFTFQIQYNKTTTATTDNNNKRTISVPVSPSSIPNCNLVKDCSSNNNYKDCSCKIIYPAEWEWKPSSDDNYIKFSSVFAILFLLLDICLIILFFFASLIVVRRL